jgi:uncharacterized protein
MMKKIFFLLLLLDFTLYAQPEIPVLKNYANDLTSTLTSSELSQLETVLKKFDDSTSNQIVFLMVNSLDGAALENYTFDVASKNKIGSAKNNNGILFFIAKNDRKLRIEVGYGLEGALPDAICSSILRNEVRPFFREGDYYQGVEAGLNAIISATRGEYKGEPKDSGTKGKGFPFVFIIILIAVIFSIFRRGGGGGGILPWIILGSLGNNRGGGWGSSGGSGSGGFGGFSGGGGSFGGGGASGGW